MRKKLLCVALLAGLFNVPVFANESPVSLKIVSNYRVKVISDVDEVTITGVDFNRGNCDVSDANQVMSNLSNAFDAFYSGNRNAKVESAGVPERTLSFGQSAEYVTTNCNMGNIREIQVHTDLGDWVFSNK